VHCRPRRRFGRFDIQLRGLCDAVLTRVASVLLRPDSVRNDAQVSHDGWSAPATPVGAGATHF
jgi:hypothetical protein